MDYSLFTYTTSLKHLFYKALQHLSTKTVYKPVIMLWINCEWLKRKENEKKNERKKKKRKEPKEKNKERK